MKVKYLAAACAALCSLSAYAAPAAYNAASTTPATIIYITGASAQKNALAAAVPGAVFDTSKHGVLYISTPVKDEVAWLGDAKSSLGGGVTLVVYNPTNGSAAGLNQLISTGTPEAEASALSLPATGCGTNSTTVPSGNNANEVVACTGNFAAIESDMALSDVYVGEFADGLLTTGAKLKNAGSAASTGLEGFGVIVNGVLYDALLAKNIADGLLPATCSSATAASLVVGTGNGACQPSVRSADYAALASAGKPSAAAFGVADNAITLCRRDALSGTQAASNIFFLNNVCGTAGYMGALAIATSADTVAGVYTVVDEANSSTGKAEVCVWSGSATGDAAQTGYGIGVVSTGEKDAVDAANAKPFYFVKLDGVSPNYKANGTYDAKHRANLVDGSYKFATEMAAYVKSSTSTTSTKGKIAKAIADAVAKTDNSDLTGIAYLTGTTSAAKTARYSKGGNNCAAWQ